MAKAKVVQYHAVAFGKGGDYRSHRCQTLKEAKAELAAMQAASPDKLDRFQVLKVVTTAGAPGNTWSIVWEPKSYE